MTWDQLISNLTDDLTFWIALIGATVGGLLAITAATLSLRSARKTAIDVFRVQELQQIATELPDAFNSWATSIYAIWGHGQGETQTLTIQAGEENAAEIQSLLHAESDARRRLQSWKHRLENSGAYIREEIDLAISAFLADNKDELKARLTASSIFVNANLPSMVREEIYRRQHPFRSWLRRVKESVFSSSSGEN